MQKFWLAAALAALVVPGCGDDDGAAPDAGGPDAGVEPCEGPNGPCTVLTPSPTAQEDVQTALIEAQPGDILLFEEGTFHFTMGLSLAVPDVTLRGRGMDKTILSFADQIAGAQGLLVTGDADGVVIEDLATEDTVGDQIKLEGVDGVTIRRVRTEWTNGGATENGGYGIYPVQCSKLLIEDSVAIGASDTGIYVGQSEDVIVRRNRPQHNVAGIEIENTVRADVYDNESTTNTAGILVFSLPGLQKPESRGVRVYQNRIYENNTPNFASAGNILAQIPQGTGFATIAAHNVEVFDNDIHDNQTADLAVASFLISMVPFDDPTYDPYPDTIHIHDNMLHGGGTMPSEAFGFLLVQALSTVMDPPIVVPEMFWDGIVDPAKALPDGTLPDELKLCIHDNGDANFANLDAANDFANVTFDLAPHDCVHPAVPAVVIPGVN